MRKSKEDRTIEQALMAPVSKPQDDYVRQLENFAQALGASYDEEQGIIVKAYGQNSLVIGISSDGKDDMVDITFGQSEGGFVWSRSLKIYKPYAGELKAMNTKESAANKPEPQLFDTAYQISDGVNAVVRAYECGLNIPQDFMVGIQTFNSDFRRALGKSGRGYY